MRAFCLEYGVTLQGVGKCKGNPPVRKKQPGAGACRIHQAADRVGGDPEFSGAPTAVSLNRCEGVDPLHGIVTILRNCHNVLRPGGFGTRSLSGAYDHHGPQKIPSETTTSLPLVRINTLELDQHPQD